MSGQFPQLAPEQLAQDLGPAVNITAWVTTGIGIAIVGLKLFTRTRITRITGWDDVLIFLSLVSLLRDDLLVHTNMFVLRLSA